GGEEEGRVARLPADEAARRTGRTPRGLPEAPPVEAGPGQAPRQSAGVARPPPTFYGMGARRPVIRESCVPGRLPFLLRVSAPGPACPRNRESRRTCDGGHRVLHGASRGGP